MKLRQSAAVALRMLVLEAAAAREMGAGSRTGLVAEVIGIVVEGVSCNELVAGVNCNGLVVGENGDVLAGVEVGMDILWGVVVKEMVVASNGSVVVAGVRVEGVNIQHMEAEVVVEALYKVVAMEVEENGQVVVVVVMVMGEVGKDKDRLEGAENVVVVVVSEAEGAVNAAEEAVVEANYSSKEWVLVVVGVSIQEVAVAASLAVAEVVAWDSKLAEGMVKEAEEVSIQEVEASRQVAEVMVVVEKAAGEMAGEEAGESKQVEVVVEVNKLVAGAVEVGEVSKLGVVAMAAAEVSKPVGVVAEASKLVAAVEVNTQGVVGAGEKGEAPEVEAEEAGAEKAQKEHTGRHYNPQA